MPERSSSFNPFILPKMTVEQESYFGQFQPPRTPEASFSDVKNYEGKSQFKPHSDFPIFRGKDLQSWIYRVEQLLDYFRIESD